ncbi:protein toll-like [Armigeres subalbatus]|uniref:protein toll-like n=1 Tax=Armigeres subalbatus TaxID=124917 RepID=UPI002ED42FA1
MKNLVNFVLFATFGTSCTIFKTSVATLCDKFRTLPPSSECNCTDANMTVLCHYFEIYQAPEDNSTLCIGCNGNQLQFKQPTLFDVDFSGIREVEVQSCILNDSFKSMLQRIGIRDVQAVILNENTQLGDTFVLSGLNITKVEIFAKNMTWVNNDTFPLDEDQFGEFPLSNSNVSFPTNNFLSNNPSLNTLSITNNKSLKDLPKIMAIPSLKKLYLDHNNISIITSALFSMLQNLTLLDLEQNPIGTIAEDAFRSNRELAWLRLRFVRTQLPDNIFEPLTKLTELRIVDGLLQHIQERMFWSQTQLIILDLSGNQLTVLGNRVFLHLTSLKSLKIDRNNLSVISCESFPSKAHNLSIISLNWNKFTNIPFEGHNNSCTPELSVARLSNNAIKSLSINAIPPSLRYFDLSYNQIKSIEIDKDTLDGRLKLELSVIGNPLEFNCKMINFVQMVQKDKLKLNHSERFNDLVIDQLYCDLEAYPCPQDCNNCRLVGPQRELVLDCSNKNLRKVPQISPYFPLKYSSIVLNVRNNAIKQLPTIKSNPGFGFVNTLLIDNNFVESWKVSSLHKNLTVISMNNNSLTSIDEKLLRSAMHLSNLTQINLLENNLHCYCTYVKHILLLRSKIANLSALTCATGQLLVEFEKSCEPNNHNSVLILFLILTIIVSGLLIYYRYQPSIKKWLFIKHLCLGYVSEAEADEDLQYDAFISYSRLDEHFVIHQLIPTLEAPPQNYRVCIHLRKLVPGVLLQKQVLNAIANSRRTIIYITRNFLRYEWTRAEFRLAFEHSLRQNRARLIVILANDVVQLDELDPQLRVFFSTTTYIRKDDERFREKLLYAMPHRDIEVMQREQGILLEEGRLRDSLLREMNRHRERIDLGDVEL